MLNENIVLCSAGALHLTDIRSKIELLKLLLNDETHAHTQIWDTQIKMRLLSKDWNTLLVTNMKKCFSIPQHVVSTYDQPTLYFEIV